MYGEFGAASPPVLLTIGWRLGIVPGFTLVCGFTFVCGFGFTPVGGFVVWREMVPKDGRHGAGAARP